MLETTLFLVSLPPPKNSVLGLGWGCGYCGGCDWSIWISSIVGPLRDVPEDPTTNKRGMISKFVWSEFRGGCGCGGF